MLSTNYTEKLVGLKDVIVKNVIKNSDYIQIEIEIVKQEQHCPCCCAATRAVHDYRMQKIKDLPAFGMDVILLLRKRRYRCNHCGKRFYEPVEFLPRYHRMTGRLVAHVISELADVCTFSSVARRHNISSSTAIRIFNLVDYGKPELPDVLSIDEFKGNTGHEKYQVILTDPKSRKVLDILPSRLSHELSDYFKNTERKQVKFFISDMWKPYFEIADTFFKDAIPIVDKYHYVRQVVWALEAVRKEEQKKFSKSHRRYFKRSKSLLIKPYDKLTDDQKTQVNVMLYASGPLSSAYFLKEKFFQVMKSKNRDEARQSFKDWIAYAYSSDIPAFHKCADTFSAWIAGILNSFDYRYTNGFTEGCNNRIKVLKRNAYGYRNYRRFRNRILHIFNASYKAKQAVAA